jgi:hypothetical protein
MVIVSRGLSGKKREFGAKYSDFNRILPVYLADIRYSTCIGFLIGCIECKMKFCIRYNQLESQHRSRTKHQQDIVAEYGQNSSISAQTSLFCQIAPIETINIQCRIKFCIQHNQLNCQHSSDSEYRRAILAGRRQNPSISPQSLLFCSISSLESITIRLRI